MIALLTGIIPFSVGSVLVINDSTIDWYYTFLVGSVVGINDSTIGWYYTFLCRERCRD